jgi:predicted transcriptional regulator
MAAMPERSGPGIELLADPMCRRMIGLLAVRPRRPASLATELGLSRPATTRELHLLVDAGLVRAIKSEVDRRGMVYTIDPANHGRITAWLADANLDGAPMATTPGSP